MSHVMHHMSCVTCHASNVMRQMSCVTCHASNVMRHMSCVTCHFLSSSFLLRQSGEACWWRVCYQRGLPRLVVMSFNTKWVWSAKLLYTLYIQQTQLNMRGDSCLSDQFSFEFNWNPRTTGLTCISSRIPLLRTMQWNIKSDAQS